MTIKHHLPDSTLLAYSAGTLSEAFNLIVASHLSLCDQCRAAAESHDALGGSLLSAQAPSAMAQDSLAKTLAGLEDTPAAPLAPAPSRGVFPAPLQDHIGGDLDHVRWRPVGMGIQQMVLKTAPGARARLLLIPRSAAMPAHGHKGTEMTLVLQGAYADARGRFARGDVDLADPDTTHRPVADPGDDCICLAVTDAPLRFAGWLPRIMQRLTGL